MSYDRWVARLATEHLNPERLERPGKHTHPPRNKNAGDIGWGKSGVEYLGLRLDLQRRNDGYMATAGASNCMSRLLKVLRLNRTECECRMSEPGRGDGN